MVFNDMVLHCLIRSNLEAAVLVECPGETSRILYGKPHCLIRSNLEAAVLVERTGETLRILYGKPHV